MQHTFGVDVLACARCGGRMRVVATIEDPVVIRRILTHLGLPSLTCARCLDRLRRGCSSGWRMEASIRNYQCISCSIVFRETVSPLV